VELSATGEIIINQRSLEVARVDPDEEAAMEEVHEEAQQAATYSSFTSRCGVLASWPALPARSRASARLTLLLMGLM
jgi:hypothetical protein